jgi:uncharacterized protein
MPAHNKLPLEDYDAVARQLGRRPRPFRVAARCPFGMPSVIENERKREMPTSFWVTCPSLVGAISGVESTGGVRGARDVVGEATVEEIHNEHTSLYGTRVAGVRDTARGSVKCLHAFTALHVSGPSPIPWPNGPSGASRVPTRKAVAAVRRMRMTSRYTPDRIPGA